MDEEEKFEAVPQDAVGPTEDEELDETARKCGAERETLAAHETAECAGADLAGQYDNEESGGS